VCITELQHNHGEKRLHPFGLHAKFGQPMLLVFRLARLILTPRALAEFIMGSYATTGEC
jgi:hypothetical protein